MEKVQKTYDKSPDADVGIWIWEDRTKSENFDACTAEKAYLTTFKDALMISCDKKGSKEKRVGTETYK